MKLRSIRSSLVISFAAVIVLGTFLLGGFSWWIMRKNLVENSQRTTHVLVSQVQRVVDTYLGYMEDIAQVVLSNSDVQELLGSRRTGPEMVRARTVAFLKGIRQVRRDIDSIALRTPLGEVLTSEPGRPINPRWASQVPSVRVSPARVENLFDDRYTWVISLHKTLDGAVPGGFIQVDLNYAIISDLCRQVQLGRSGYVFIVNGNGELIYHPQQQLIYSNLKTEAIGEILALKDGELRAKVDGQDRIYSVVTSPSTGWTVVGVSFADEVLSGTRDLEYGIWMFALGCFLVTVLVGWGLSLWISRPIEALRKSMQRVETGDFNIEIRVKAHNEIAQLAEDCDIAIRKVRDLLAQSLHEQELKRRLSLLMLQSQINPHFLYNTLDAIIWMIELGDHREAITMTSALAKFFRLGISKGSEIISIRHEIGHVESYLAILKLRYRSKLTYSIDIDPSLHDHRILKLLLQPLVENAHYHGIKTKEGPGHIRISGTLEGDRIFLRVEDDGVGMDEATLAGLLVDDAGHESDHVGVKNVHQRIGLYFGQEYGLRFASTPGQGTVVTVELPAILEREALA